MASARILLACLGGYLVGCATQQSDPVSPNAATSAPAEGSESSATPSEPVEARIAERDLRAQSATAVEPVPEAETTPPPVEPAPVDPVPPLLDADGKPLAQTEARPSADSASFRRRLELLVQAIATDAPDVAMPAFFPVEAYAQVKAIARPERDWEWRLVGAFKRNVHEYHKRLGANAEGLKLVEIKIPEANAKWMEPNSEGNRIGYFRVLRSALVVEDAQGKQHSLELTSLISWRGEWYVVHLHGFK